MSRIAKWVIGYFHLHPFVCVGALHPGGEREAAARAGALFTAHSGGGAGSSGALPAHQQVPPNCRRGAHLPHGQLSEAASPLRGRRRGCEHRVL